MQALVAVVLSCEESPPLCDDEPTPLVPIRPFRFERLRLGGLGQDEKVARRTQGAVHQQLTSSDRTRFLPFQAAPSLVLVHFPAGMPQPQVQPIPAKPLIKASASYCVRHLDK